MRAVPRLNVARLLKSVCLLVLWLAPATWANAQEQPRQAVYRVEVDLVQVTVAVTNPAGRYIRGLRPADFTVYEDGIPQKVAMFSEGGAAPQPLWEIEERERETGRPAPAVVAGSHVFILFDTSNFMYRGFFVYAQDAVAQFIHGLNIHDSIALYAFSRNLLRACPPTLDRRQALLALRQLVAGADTSIYNAMLLTLQDAARLPGPKVVVVFSNGPDVSSIVSPEAVRELAENEGIPIYIISTEEANRDKVSATVFRRLSGRTGGKAYVARTWKQQTAAFKAIGEDVRHLYVLSYYPTHNAKLGWRSINVELAGERVKKYRIRTRTGYRSKVSTAERLGLRRAPAASFTSP